MLSTVDDVKRAFDYLRTRDRLVLVRLEKVQRHWWLCEPLTRSGAKGWGRRLEDDVFCAVVETHRFVGSYVHGGYFFPADAFTAEVLRATIGDYAALPALERSRLWPLVGCFRTDWWKVPWAYPELELGVATFHVKHPSG